MKEKRLLVGKSDLVAAANSGAMATQDVDSLWNALEESTQEADSKSFDIAQLLWYAGGALVMLAMGWFMERAWEAQSHITVLALCLGYTAAFCGLGFKLKDDGLKGASSVLYLLAVLMTPFTVAAAMEIGKMQIPDVFFRGDNQALILEGATLLVSAFALSRVRRSLMTLPVFGSLWLLSITAAAVYTGERDLFFGFSSHYFHFVSMTIGLLILAAAFVTDLNFGRNDEDYSYWGYFFGTAAFWIPMSMLDSGSELGKLIYFFINVAMMLSSVVLRRRVLLLAGSLGAVGYVGHIIWTFFSDSLALPFVLILAGLGVIYLGLQYRRRQADIERVVMGWVPSTVRKRLPGPRD